MTSEPSHGLLVIDKPSGLTSHDVVNAVRHLLKLRRVGHAGTLDPSATGVLVVLVGAATRLAQFIVGHDKCYDAVIRLGTSTTTYDAEGEIIDSQPVDVAETAIHAALLHFTGEIAQLPPMYAAVKVGGRKLYELARQGHDVERPTRRVTIHSLRLLEWMPPDLHIEVICSAGTYVRSLAHDIGQRLGCGAHLARLRRTRSGPFGIEQSCSLDRLHDHIAQGTLSDVLLPPAAALHGIDRVQLDAKQEADMRYGRQLVLAVSGSGDTLQAWNAQGRLVGVLNRTENHTWQPTIVLPPLE